MSQPWRPKFRYVELAAPTPATHDDMAMKLPEELWRQIFWEASSTPGVDEFSTDPAFHFNNLPMGDMGTSIMKHPHHLGMAIRTRLQLVLVCRNWASFGTSILWAHLRLPLRDPSNVLETLRQRPVLGEYVRRISPKETDLYLNLQEISDDGSLQVILNLCPNLHAIKVLVPHRYILEFPQSLRHIHISIRSSCPSFPILPQSITSLRLETESKPFWVTPLTQVEFPNLQSLDLSRTPNNDWIDAIVNNWSLPSLKMLTLPAGNVSRPMQLLQRYAATVNVLRMARTLCTPGWEGITFNIPQLKHLYISQSLDTLQCLLKIPTIPHLQLISVYWPFYIGIPQFESGKAHTKANFSTLLNQLGSWSPPRATIRLLGRDEICDWVLDQAEVLRAIEALRVSGRVVERETIDGDIVTMPPYVG